MTTRTLFNRRNKLNKDGTSSILIEIYIKRGIPRYYHDPKINITPEFWDPKKHRVNPKHANANRYNKTLSDIETNLFNFNNDQERIGATVTLPQVLDFINKRKFSDLTFPDFMADRITASKSDPDVKKHYNTVLTTLKTFNDKLSMSDIKAELGIQWDDYLHKLNKGTSSIWTHHKFLKKFINEAEALKKITHENNPYHYFKFSCPKGTREYLTQDELTAFETVTLNSPSLQAVRDIFVFCAYTGMHYKEIKTLNKNHIRNINGHNVIVKQRTKTDENTFIPILPKAQQVLDKNTQPSDSPNVFNLISGQKINAYLKVIATFAKIDRNLTLNMARHTFATTVTLLNGVSKEALQGMLGHASIKTTEHYARIVNQKITNEMNDLQTKIQTKIETKKEGDKNQPPIK